MRIENIFFIASIILEFLYELILDSSLKIKFTSRIGVYGVDVYQINFLNKSLIIIHLKKFVILKVPTKCKLQLMDLLFL